MTTFRKTLAVAIAALSLGLVTIAAPASAHESFHFGHEHFGHEHFHFGHEHFGFGGYSYEAHEYRACPYGMHLGPYGHYCWPDRD
jgi:hypothetical protein